MNSHFAMALIFRLFRLPKVGNQEVLKVEKGEAAKQKNLVLGLAAIFAYAGGEVIIDLSKFRNKTGPVNEC